MPPAKKERKRLRPAPNQEIVKTAKTIPGKIPRELQEQEQTTSQEKSIHARRPARCPRTPPILALPTPKAKNARAAHSARSKAAIQVQAKQKGMR
jgi:hypothetical protein